MGTGVWMLRCAGKLCERKFSPGVCVQARPCLGLSTASSLRQRQRGLRARHLNAAGKKELLRHLEVALLKGQMGVVSDNLPLPKQYRVVFVHSGDA